MEDESIHIVMEYAEKGDLYKVRIVDSTLFTIPAVVWMYIDLSILYIPIKTHILIYI
jgi:hypothetical protein